MHLSYFRNKNQFHENLATLFQDLKIPVSHAAAQSLSPESVLADSWNGEKECFSLISEIYLSGIVDEAAFRGKTGENWQSIRTSDKDYDGILIFGVSLKQRANGLLPTRTHLAEITRAFNREFNYTPVAVVFLYDKYLTIANAERVPYKRGHLEGEKVRKISMLREIDVAEPHTGHLKLLHNLVAPAGIRNFQQLYEHWQSVFDVSLLNKQFYSELAHWYYWARKQVKFPNDLKNSEEQHISSSLIRLLTRIIFVWFLKEKDLVPRELFQANYLNNLLKGFQIGEESDSFYRGILQNLFFATLNQKSSDRRFATEGKSTLENRDHYGIKTLYRYSDLFNISRDEIIQEFSETPYLNGGLFECLDFTDEHRKVIYQDGFSRNPRKRAFVPDYLFFADDRTVDLSDIYENGNASYKVKGLIPLLSSYIFTVTENSPIEEDVALDPELLGKVFENLLASYNPETASTARQQTGSFYTPREIVDYMVDESLKEYLSTQYSAKPDDFEKHLDLLFSYSEENPFSVEESTVLLQHLNQSRIFDPACGSGAFPMGILQKMVFLLHKLDPDNSIWKAEQLLKVEEETMKAFVHGDKAAREERLLEINDSFFRCFCSRSG